MSGVFFLGSSSLEVSESFCKPPIISQDKISGDLSHGPLQHTGHNVLFWRASPNSVNPRVESSHRNFGVRVDKEYTLGLAKAYILRGTLRTYAIKTCGL